MDNLLDGKQIGVIYKDSPGQIVESLVDLPIHIYCCIPNDQFSVVSRSFLLCLSPWWGILWLDTRRVVMASTSPQVLIMRIIVASMSPAKAIGLRNPSIHTR